MLVVILWYIIDYLLFFNPWLKSGSSLSWRYFGRGTIGSRLLARLEIKEARHLEGQWMVFWWGELIGFAKVRNLIARSFFGFWRVDAMDHVSKETSTSQLEEYQNVHT